MRNTIKKISRVCEVLLYFFAGFGIRIAFTEPISMVSRIILLVGVVLFLLNDVFKSLLEV